MVTFEPSKGARSQIITSRRRRCPAHIRAPFVAMSAPRRSRRVAVDATASADVAMRASSDASALDAGAYVPPQEVFKSGVDHRSITKTVRHGKRKRDGDDGDDADVDMNIDTEALRAFKAPRATYEVVVGSKSGLPWKQPAKRASALKRVPSSKTWDERMAEKNAKKLFQDAKKRAKAEAGARAKAERERREAKKAQKEENRRRTGVGAPTEITNPKTIAKKSAKERAKLKALRML